MGAGQLADADGGVGVDGAKGAILAALPPLLYAAMGSQARFAVSGMETLLFGFLVVAASYFWSWATGPWPPAPCSRSPR